MGVFYSIYGEILYRNEWWSLNFIHRNIETGEFKIKPLWSGGSVCRDAIDELENSSFRGLPKDLGAELRELLNVDEDFEDPISKMKVKRFDFYSSFAFFVDYNRAIAIRVVNKSKKEHAGYVRKNA